MADDVVVFVKPDLPMSAFPVMEEIRRKAKLCDVTLKVRDIWICLEVRKSDDLGACDRTVL